MGIIETIIIGASMSMDAFAISVCSGLKMQRVNYAKAALIAFFFGGFQALMPALGWIFGSLFASYVDRWDHYIAFVVLAYLGAKMIIDVFKSSGDSEDASALDLRSIFMVAFATSVDTLAVGVTSVRDADVDREGLAGEGRHAGEPHFRDAVVGLRHRRGRSRIGGRFARDDAVDDGRAGAVAEPDDGHV